MQDNKKTRFFPKKGEMFFLKKSKIFPNIAPLISKWCVISTTLNLEMVCNQYSTKPRNGANC